jgi:hypothetical protein
MKLNDYLVAMKPTLFFSHDRANAQFILGTHRGRSVVVKMSIPDVNGTMAEQFEVIYEGDEQSAMERIMDIVRPRGLRLVRDEELAEAA